MIVAVEVAAAASAADTPGWQQVPLFHQGEFQRYSAEGWHSCSLADWQRSGQGQQSENGIVSAVALEGAVALPARRPGKVLVGLERSVAHRMVVARVASDADQAMQALAVLVHSAAAVRWMHSGHYDRTHASSLPFLLLDDPVLVRAMVLMEALGRWTLLTDREPVRHAFGSRVKATAARHGHHSS